MNRVWGIVVAVALLVAASTSAEAQKKFDDLASSAVEVRSPKALASLFWAHQADCSKSKTDLERRQCEGIRAARLSQISGTVYLVNGDANAFAVGDYDAKKKQVPIGVHTCVACVTALDLDGQRRYVVGMAGSPVVDGGAVKAPRKYGSKKKFKTERAAKRWKNKAVPRLKTEFLVRVPDQPRKWAKGGAQGYKVEIVGYRVYDPCDGAIVCAKPQSVKQPGDRRYCKGEPVVEGTTKPGKPAPAVKKKPWRLTPRMIKRALRKAERDARKCYDTYGVPGTARFRITVNGDGDIVGLEQRGDFTDTPTGKCVQKAVKSVKFPESKRKRTTIDWPIMVR